MFIYGSAIAIIGALFSHKQQERLTSSEILKKSEDSLASYSVYSNMLLVTRESNYKWAENTPKIAGNKCPCCGSYEFRQHVSIFICSYCRVPK